jgi:hypothetical protein
LSLIRLKNLLPPRGPAGIVKEKGSKGTFEKISGLATFYWVRGDEDRNEGLEKMIEHEPIEHEAWPRLSIPW